MTVQVLGATSDDPVGHPLPEPCGLGLGKSMLTQSLANGTFGAGRGADHVGVRTQESSHKCISCKGTELATLSWLDVPITSCFLGGAVIIMLLGSAGMIPLQLRLGREGGGSVVRAAHSASAQSLIWVEAQMG